MAHPLDEEGEIADAKGVPEVQNPANDNPQSERVARTKQTKPFRGVRHHLSPSADDIPNPPVDDIPQPPVDDIPQPPVDDNPQCPAEPNIYQEPTLGSGWAARTKQTRPFRGTSHLLSAFGDEGKWGARNTRQVDIPDADSAFDATDEVTFVPT